MSKSLALSKSQFLHLQIGTLQLVLVFLMKIKLENARKANDTAGPGRWSFFHLHGGGHNRFFLLVGWEMEVAPERNTLSLNYSKSKRMSPRMLGPRTIPGTGTSFPKGAITSTLILSPPLHGLPLRQRRTFMSMELGLSLGASSRQIIPHAPFYWTRFVRACPRILP